MGQKGIVALEGGEGMLSGSEASLAGRTANSERVTPRSRGAVGIGAITTHSHDLSSGTFLFTA